MRRMPVPIQVTAIVDLRDGDTLEDAELLASEMMRTLQELVTLGCDGCERAPGDRCDWHRVRFVVGQVGRSLFERAAN